MIESVRPLPPACRPCHPKGPLRPGPGPKVKSILTSISKRPQGSGSVRQLRRLPKQMTKPNASSTRLLTPSFSLYRFVISRTSGAEYIFPLSSRTARRANAGPAQAVTQGCCRRNAGMPARVQLRLYASVVARPTVFH